MSTDVRSLRFLAGGGELGGLIRAHDWSRTPLGPPESWPQALRIAVGIMLTSRQPIWIGWGDDLTYLYNDPYKAIIGGKHPEALGRPTRVVWSEIWDVIEPMLSQAQRGSEGTYVESQLLIMERYGYREETYYTFSYSPIPGDDGVPGGIICANTDDTQRVIGERQLALLRDLGAAAADARTWREACALSAGALAANPWDLPYALVYVANDDGDLELAGASGIAPGHAGAPEVLAADTPSRLRAALDARAVTVVEIGIDGLPSGAWDEPPTRAAIVPLAGVDGALAVALNPFRQFDDAYSDFLTLVAGQIAASIASATAYEQERRRAEALAELDRAKTVFFSNVSHELRTPLTLMLGPLDDVLSQQLPADTRDTLEMTRRNALRLLRMVNTVLDFSRVGASQSGAEYRPTDLSAATAEIARRFGSVIERGGVSFEIDCAPLPAPVYIDTDAWEKIVLNLLSNAFKFTLAGSITVRVDAVDGRARLVVADTGSGIPADELPHLFERFHRVRNENARTQEGTGIGLALVRELVEVHGGEIAAESVAGEGTAFTITLPFGSGHLASEHVRHEELGGPNADIALAYVEEASRWIGIEDDDLDVAPGDDDDAVGAPDDGRIAVVDDNSDMRDYLRAVLERRWRVDTYPDGRTALAAIREDPPALVVTDVMMPHLDGFGLLAALRADSRTSTIPVIVVSARAGEESSVEGLEAGADDYLVKPFSARELVARVRVNLDLARARAEAGRLSALEEVRSRVITTVSHELRTPVSAIYGATRTLDRPGVDDATREALLGVIAGESERLARITDDILTTESLASGLMAVEVERFDLREAVTAAVDAVRARLTPGLQLEAMLSPEPVPVAADRGRLQQVLGNLLDNAFKYSPEGGTVRALVSPDGDHASIVVSDEGLGVPDDARDAIFQRFYRVDPQLRRGIGGSGLGLYICRELVQAMGGTIAYEPNEPAGSRFVVRLPVAERATPAH
jgi:signal transduction histidine kinase